MKAPLRTTLLVSHVLNLFIYICQLPQTVRAMWEFVREISISAQRKNNETRLRIYQLCLVQFDGEITHSRR